MNNSIDIVNKNNIVPEYNNIENKFNLAFNLVDDVVLKNYITKLREMDIIPLDNNEVLNNISKNVRLFKINEMVYQQDEYSLHKFTSVFNAVSTTDSVLFVIIDSDGEKTEFYMGIRSINSENSTKTCYDTLSNAIKGQFPGIKTTNLLDYEMKNLFNKIDVNSISIISGVSNTKDKEKHEDKYFVQGLEKLALSMRGEKYTGIIIANPLNKEQLFNIRKEYEQIYTSLSPFSGSQISYGLNKSQSTSKAITEGITNGENYNKNSSVTTSEGNNKSTSYSNSTSKETTRSIAGKTIGTSLALAGATIGSTIGSIIPGGGTLIGGIIGGTLTGVVGNAISNISHETVSNTKSNSDSYTSSKSNTIGDSYGYSKTINKSRTNTNAFTNGSNENIQLNIENKSIKNYLERIDKQLERLNESESIGMWECAAYFMSENSYASEIAASTYKALMTGENSGVEVSAINSWNKREKEKVKLLKDYVTNFIHPIFKYNNGMEIAVSPTSIVSGNELAINMGLPRKSVCGFPVIEHADFAKEIVRYDKKNTNNSINLGSIFNMGEEFNTRTLLDVQSLSMHTFISGSTGSGKSNTIYEILDQIDTLGIKYLIIEPAKGEYKNIFGNKKGVRVLGTNPNISELIKINPFKFPGEIHVLEHIDRIIEIFNVCWPMYAAMPAVLKEAVIKAYESSGWDLINSKNIYSDDLFPTFNDLLIELENVISNSAYSEEVKSNYTGALITRVRSMVNGLNGRIFSADEIDNEILFDSNVIVDLSRVGSIETKSLIMGILIMRLNEHRMCFTNGMNVPLKHITVLEEAHNILKKSSSEQSVEGNNLTGKSVEMISNSIAEMRTYGEGFIIVDQSPSTVDLSAIRNTNTKVIMRLPDEIDRRLVGKSAGLKDNQLDEIAKLPKGVAVVYQNDWLEPVLCKIKKFNYKESIYKYNKGIEIEDNNLKIFNSMILKLLLKNRVDEKIDIDIDCLENLTNKLELRIKNKIAIREFLNEYKENGKLKIWEEDRFDLLSEIISGFIGSKSDINKAIYMAEDYNDLTTKLNRLIENNTYELSEDLKLSVNQCLLKNISVESPEKKEIYSAWISNLRRKYL